MAPGKRKRPERGSGDSGENRPSPHRPGNTHLGQHDRGPEMRDSGRRSSRGGQGLGGGARGGRRNDGRDFSSSTRPSMSTTATPTSASGPMSPPPRPPSATQTPTPTLEMPSPVAKRNPAPFEYVFLTDERMSSWEAKGRQEVIAQGEQARNDEDNMDLTAVFHELIRATLDGRISATDSGNCVKEMLGPDPALSESLEGAFDARTLFVDSFSMICDTEEPPFSPALRPFAAATGVSPDIFRQKLDAQLLQDLGLTRETFIRVGIRQATHLLYRQANYNLLREESEGYSKLITELFTSTRDLTGNEIPPSEVVENAFERLKGLIGTFDLDVGRVLDITLDVFASVLVKQFRFYIKLLRVSSWWPRSGLSEATANAEGLPAWALPGYHAGLTLTEDEEEALKKQEEDALRPRMIDRDRAFWNRVREIGQDAFFELGGRHPVDAESKARIFGGKGADDTELDADRQWIEGTGTLPPPGNRVAAQLLGFKLRFYVSPAHDKNDVFPKNLIWLTALLIKIGFISLRDIYPHLWPSDEEMPAIQEFKMKALAEEERMNRPGGGTANALMMAGALADDTLPSGNRPRETPTVKTDATPTTSTEAEDQEDLSSKLKDCDQKEWLLECLLTIGAIPESLFMLGRFPWLPEAYPELYRLINRLIQYSIKDVYDSACPKPSHDILCPTKQVAAYEQSGMPKGQVRIASMPPRKLLRWPYADKFDTAENNSYRFYWDEWGDNVPVCQNVDDIFTLCSTFLNYSGVNIGRDAELLSKLARIGVKSLTDDPSPHNLERWQDLLKRLLVPALSLTKANTSVVNEVYDMLRFYPVFIRYSIYAEWFEGQISRLPAMKVAFARTRLETNHTMKRISMTNLTAMARSLAKTAYASPGIVFSVALSQIEAYTNLTEVVVECAKYFTDLAYDVLVWSLMSSLGGKDRDRTNAEFALLPSRWLLALSRFSGKVFKRYSIMNLSPLIRYVDNQLYQGNSTDLVILQELIAQMAGVVPDTDFTDAQLTAMTGGEVLRRQTLINLQDKRYESTKTAKRLMRALTETKLAGNLLISIAQHKQAAIYRIPDKEAHIKLLATMIDDAQLILFQYLDLLRSNLPVDEFDKHVPGIPELLTEYGLEAPLAFMIGRASLVHRVAHATSALNGTTIGLSFSTTVDVRNKMEVDVTMEDNTEATTANGQVTNSDVQMTNVTDESSSGPASSISATNAPVDPSYDVMHPIISTVKSILPESSFKELSPDFYVTFWTSTLSDLSIPSSSYEAEIQRLRSEQESIMKDRSDMTRAGMAKKEDTKKHLAETREALIAELSKQVDSFGQAKTRLLKQKFGWFEQFPRPDTVSDAFLEMCLIPRLLLSPSDADFCFRMIRFLHDNGVPNFRTLSLYGRIFRANRLRSIIFTCSVREAENLGRFLRLALTDLARWHADAAVYEKEALGGTTKSRTGFIKGLNSDGTPKGWLEYDGEFGYKNILYAWHKNLNTALRICLDGTEWMHIRNAITVLKSVAEVFPAVDFMGNNFIKQLEAIIAREKGVREDLALTGNAVLVLLRKRSKQWVMVQAFGYSLSKPGQTNGTASRATSQSAPVLKPTLKATAPEFKPQSRASSQGVSTPKPMEVEDGEVDDAKTSRTAANKADTATKDIPDTTSTLPAVSPPPEPKKSEVLLKREQFQREAAAKALASSQPRPDYSRTPIFPSLDRGSSHLPSRPDAPFPPRHQLDRPRNQDWKDGRDTRDSRMADSSRMDRPDRLGERNREYSGSEWRAGDTGPRDYSRTLDRNAMSDRDRARPDPPRWTGDSTRENFERTANINRAAESGRLSRETAMPPSRSSALSADRGPVVGSERAPPVNPQRQELINPERAALISDPRSESPHRRRDEPREERRSPPPQSPRRYVSERDRPDSRREDRPRTGPSNTHPPSRGRIEDNPPPPVGPRNDRLSDRVSERVDRQAFQPTPPPPRSVDPDHGRLNMGARQQPDPNFGRLNSTPAQDIPSGPRDRNLRGNRMSSGPWLGGRTPTETPRPPTPDMQPPSGPSSGRHPRRSASGQFDTASVVSSSVATTPAASGPGASIHPDRLKVFGGPGTQPSQTPQSSAPAAGPMHPDRVRAFENEPPTTPSPTTQMNNARSRPPLPPVVTAGPPLGPKGSQSSPVTAGTNGMGPPTGPASASERVSRGGRRQFAAINNTLQQSSVPDRINVRGRGRVAAGGPDIPIISPSGHASAPELSQFGRPISRDGGRDLINPERSEFMPTNQAPIDDRAKDRGVRRERSGRHSHRSSRSPDGHPWDGQRGVQEENRPPRGEPRDRRGGDREPDRERHQGRSPRHDLIAGREVMGGSREASREHRDRDSTRRGDGRDRDGGSVRETHDTPWTGERMGSGRNRELRGDERRDTRGSRGDDAGRKRRSEDGIMDSRGQDKRPRR